MRVDPIFGFEVPESCPGVPQEILDPANTWSDRGAYEAKAKELAQAFHENFSQFADMVSEGLSSAGPVYRSSE
jgi:phosphoenolpyruvate carboxykinase (ATP)